MEIFRPKTLNGYTHMKGKGVRNIQHEYTAKTPLSYIVSSTCRRSKRPFFVPVQAITSHRNANEEDNQIICYDQGRIYVPDITDKHKCLYNTVT